MKAPVFAMLIGWQARIEACRSGTPPELGRLTTVAVCRRFPRDLADALFAVLFMELGLIYPVLEVKGLVNRFGSQIVHNAQHGGPRG